MNDMEWTTEYPTKPGVYWVRNIVFAHQARQNLPSEPGPYIVEMCDYYGDNDGLDILWPGDEAPTGPSDVISAEWQGPIHPQG